jgi:hypothetical protein
VTASSEPPIPSTSDLLRRVATPTLVALKVPDISPLTSFTSRAVTRSEEQPQPPILMLACGSSSLDRTMLISYSQPFTTSPPDLSLGFGIFR